MFFTLISCSKWDRAAVGYYVSVESQVSMELTSNFESRLVYKGKTYKGKWNTDGGKDANVVYLYFGDTVFQGIIPNVDSDTIVMDNEGNSFGKNKSQIVFKKE